MRGPNPGYANANNNINAITTPGHRGSVNAWHHQQQQQHQQQSPLPRQLNRPPSLSSRNSYDEYSDA